MERSEKDEFTGIEWTDQTWNPVTGCTKISSGCKHCYAETLSRRLHRMGNPRYKNKFVLTLHPDKLDEPRRWRKPRFVFVNSMSDILHAHVPDDFILRAFRTMAETPHTYQVLTKRPERWASITRQVVGELGRWPRNIWPGTSIENRAVIEGTRKIAPRLDALAQAGDNLTIRMLSMEPLLGSLVPACGDASDLAVELEKAGIGWVISGGEAGFKARPADIEWFREIRDACREAGIPYFHKQHGGPGTTKTIKRGGKLATLDGRLWHQMPVREKPEGHSGLFASRAPA